MPHDPPDASPVSRERALQLALDGGGKVVVGVATGDTSMVPHLRGGDAFLAVPIRGAFRPGDLIVFAQQDYLVIHRYLGAARTPDRTPCLRTRGDGRSEFDPPLLPDRVRGRAVALRRGPAWRSLEGRGARAYARLVAWHDLAWGAAAAAARPVGLRGAVAAMDRALLSLVAAILFSSCHRRIDPPADARSRDAV